MLKREEAEVLLHQYLLEREVRGSA